MTLTNGGTHADSTNHNSSCGSSNQIIVPKQREQQLETQLLLDDHGGLKKRLEQLKQVLNDVYKENALLKMKSAVTLGMMRLEIDSLREDRNFLIEKYHDLKRQQEELRMAEEQELAVNALIAGRMERTYSI